MAPPSRAAVFERDVMAHMRQSPATCSEPFAMTASAAANASLGCNFGRTPEPGYEDLKGPSDYNDIFAGDNWRHCKQV